MKTYAEIINDCETLVQDAGIDPSTPGANAVFATAELDALMPSALTRISQFKPWEIKTTKSTVADTRDITLTTGDKWRLLGIPKVEYLTAQNPPVYRNVSRFGDVVSIKINSRPSSAVDIYFFWNKVHLLQSAVGATELTGTVNTASVAGDVTLSVVSLGTGTVNEFTTLKITGDSTVYYVIETATISGTNAITLSVWPPITAANTIGDVVTLSLSTTLDIPLENYLARWLVAQACISKATKSYSQVNQAITDLGYAVTAIGEVAARIADAVDDVDCGDEQAALGATAITLANTEFDFMNGEVDLAKTALSSGNSLINTIPIGGGASEYMGQAASDVGVAQGYLVTGQSYLQEASADNANAAQHFSAAAANLRSASEKANEGVANLKLVATRLQVSQGGLRYEEWGRRELARVEADLRAYAGFPSSVRYSRS